MTDRELIKAEIERRIIKLNQSFYTPDTPCGIALQTYRELLSFIDTLEVKEVDLEKEIDNIWNPRFNFGWDEKSLLSMNHEGFTTIAKHFFKLGFKALKGE